MGTHNLSAELPNVLNPREGGITRSARSLRVDDKVTQIRNNYDKEVFNGDDIGRITRIDTKTQEVWITLSRRGRLAQNTARGKP